MPISINDLLTHIRPALSQSIDGFETSLDAAPTRRRKVAFIENCQHFVAHAWDAAYAARLNPAHEENNFFTCLLSNYLDSPLQKAFQNKHEFKARDESIVKIFTRLILLKLIFVAIEHNKNLSFNIFVSQNWLETQTQALGVILNRELAFKPLAYNGHAINSMNDLAAYRATAHVATNINKAIGLTLIAGVFIAKLSSEISGRAFHRYYLLLLVIAAGIMKCLKYNVIQTNQALRFFESNAQARNDLAGNNNVQKFILISAEEMKKAFGNLKELEGEFPVVNPADAVQRQGFVLR